MPFPDPLSEPITKRWSNLKAPDEEVLLSATSDVRADGTFGERWLVVTDQRIVVLPDQDQARNGFLAVPMSAISSATTVQHVGGGLLEVERDGLVLPIVEYSNSLAPKFAELARGIQQLAEGKPARDYRRATQGTLRHLWSSLAGKERPLPALRQ